MHAANNLAGTERALRGEHQHTQRTRSNRKEKEQTGRQACWWWLSSSHYPTTSTRVQRGFLWWPLRNSGGAAPTTLAPKQGRACRSSSSRLVPWEEDTGCEIRGPQGRASILIGSSSFMCLAHAYIGRRARMGTRRAPVKRASDGTCFSAAAARSQLHALTTLVTPQSRFAAAGPAGRVCR